MSETQIVRSILQALQAKGVWCWRANSGTQVLAASKVHARRVLRGAPAGTPDIIGVYPPGSGQLFGLEVKTETGRVLATQQRWHEKATAQGVRVAVVRSIRDALGALEQWRKA